MERIRCCGHEVRSHEREIDEINTLSEAGSVQGLVYIYITRYASLGLMIEDTHIQERFLGLWNSMLYSTRNLAP
jgi:hypothetical protein